MCAKGLGFPICKELLHNNRGKSSRSSGKLGKVNCRGDGGWVAGDHVSGAVEDLQVETGRCSWLTPQRAGVSKMGPICASRPVGPERARTLTALWLVGVAAAGAVRPLCMHPVGRWPTPHTRGAACVQGVPCSLVYSTEGSVTHQERVAWTVVYPGHGMLCAAVKCLLRSLNCKNGSKPYSAVCIVLPWGNCRPVVLTQMAGNACVRIKQAAEACHHG